MRANSSSLRKRLLIALLGAMMLTWVIAAATSYLDIRHEVDELFDAQLAQSAHVLLSISTHEVQEQAGSQQSQITDEALHGAAEVFQYAEKVAYQIWVEPDNLAARSRSAPTYRLSENDSGFSDRRLGDFRWRVYTTKHPVAPITIYTAERYDIRAELANNIAFRLILPLLIALPLLALLVWFGVSHALKPLKRVAGAVGCRAPANLKPITGRDIPEEVEPLVQSMNNLFERVGQAFENERRFTADASHELRTPLAGLKTHAQVALRTSDSRIQKRSLEQLIEGVNQANHLVAQLLTLARLDPLVDSDTLASEVNLCETVNQVIVELGPAAFDKNIEIGADCRYDGVIRGNRDTLAIMLRNLINNAIRYTPRRGRIQVDLVDKGNAVELAIGDSGPGIPEQEGTRVFERFYRRLGTRVPGVGLGLSVVKRIADLHHAEVGMHRSGLGGLEVRLSFPHPETRIEPEFQTERKTV